MTLKSGAIIQYLVDQYDKAHVTSYNDVIQKYRTQQWLAFQISGKQWKSLPTHTI